MYPPCENHEESLIVVRVIYFEDAGSSTRHPTERRNEARSSSFTKTGDSQPAQIPFGTWMLISPLASFDRSISTHFPVRSAIFMATPLAALCSSHAFAAIRCTPDFRLEAG